jgi:NAD(P)-dependent dehydrogenase (short-subunit alcohol dehydrogenase family)
MSEVFLEGCLLGKSALVSGGTSGINLQIAKTLVSLGATVCVFGRDAEKATRAAGEINAVQRGRAIGMSADVRDPDKVSAVIEETVRAFGTLDIAIAGAAGNFRAPAIDISPKGFKTVVDIDLLGTYNVLRLAFDQIRRPGGVMLAITAPQAVNATMFQAHVCAAKAGINMLIRCLALEWGQAGVRVNAISPGPISGTEGMARFASTPEALQRVEARTALRRLGQTDEVGDLAAFLCSDAARYVTGGIYNCDGGSELGDASRNTQVSLRRGL